MRDTADPSRANPVSHASAGPTPEEAWRMVDAWNRTDTPYPADRTVHGLFAEQAARTPDAVALVRGDDALTYGALNARAARLARRLVRMGVGPEARVGICMPRGMEVIVGILAVLKAGAAYVPLDPAYPAERLRWMLADAGAAVLLTRGGAADAPAADGVAVVDVDQDDEADGEVDGADAAERGLGARGLAYVIYTSGSTGVPKGVAVEHRGVVRLVRGANYAYFGPEETLLQTAPVSFDASTLEIWGALLNGGRLAVLPGSAPSLEEIGRALVRHRVTTLWTTAGLLQALVAERLEALAGVRQLLAGGDVLPVETVRRVRERFPGLRLINGYGPTENTTFTCCHTVDARWSGGPVPIGAPISNTRVHVLDGALRPVRPGEPGELYAGGAGVARGYLGRPAATAERFVPDPFGAEPGGRLYRTGDRARWRPDGTLDFLGRVDGQVKIRGFRVEPGEVEAAIGAIPGVLACAVAARGDDAGGRRLVAYVVGGADADTLRAHLRGRLPEHLVPDAFVPVDALPLTPNGKIDRRALPAPVFDQRDDTEREEPRTETEAALARIWCDVLGTGSAGVDAPFHALGGHSLLGIRILARISDAFGVAVPPRVLLGSGSIREVAARIDAAGSAESPSTESSAPPRVDREGPLPLSHAQEAAWFFEQLAPGSRAYRSQAVIRLRGPLDAAALERALGEIVRRHEIFRTTFSASDGVPRQHVHAPWPVHLPLADLSPLDEIAREAAADRIVRDAFLRPIDPAALPLVRWSLVRTAPEDHRLAMVEHHFVHDGWSFGIFLRELREIYLAYLDGRPSPLPDPPVQFADFAAWQRGWMEGEAARAQLAYWERELAGAPPLHLPTDRPRPAVMRFRGASERIRLPSTLVADARAFGQAHGATFFATLLSAFQAVLGRWSGQADFCVGSGLGSRGRTWMEGIIGMVVNTVALRAELDGDPGGAELLRRVRETTLRAYEHQDVPFDQVVRRVQPERTASALPVYQVAFSFHDSRMMDPAWGPLRVELAEAQSNGSAKVDLSVIVIPRAEQGVGDADEVEMVWEYDSDLFDAATVRRMIGHFQALLAGIVRAPHLPISALEMMDDDERRMMVDGWNRTDADHPSDQCIHQLFAAQAARTPDAVALIHESASLTYRALNERANRLAHRLVRLGVGPEVRVGVCLRREPELVVALLAVLKAGGAYVPLDPAYPAERLALTLADAAAPVIVTQDALRPLLPDGGAAIVRVDGNAAAIASESAGEPGIGVAPRNLAYLVYTSGSTGTPKGVAIEHGSAVAMLAWAWGAYSAEELGGMLASTSICFDMSVFELFAPLTRGGRVILVENALALPRSAAADQVRLLDTVPSAAATLLAIGEIPPGVRTVNLGGEPLPAGLVDALYARGVERVYDLYGPSEDTTFSTVALRRRGGPVTIGAPIANTRCYVLDSALRPVPIGIEGELYIGGLGVTRGYLGRPGLTAGRYVPDHLGGEPGARLYRTGDRIRRRADGTLEYLGRLDAQLKIRGFRVEPGEIEAALRRHPGVGDCVVVAREDAPGDRRLVAYVAGDADAESLRSHLRGVLPDHMVPFAFVVLDALPLTPNGKIDRRALPAPGLAASAEPTAAPATPGEQALAAIWAGVLGVERVGVNDSFFELGGHSLALVVLKARLEKALGREVPMPELFRYPTVRSFHAAQAGTDMPALGAAARGEERGAARRAAFARERRR
jgi:amino acid adenylation domain-containing protein